MKKVLKLVLVVALALALSVSVFAAASPEKKGGNDKPDGYVAPGSTSSNATVSGSTNVIAVTTNAPANVKFTVGAADANAAASNAAFAQQRFPGCTILGSYDITATVNGVGTENPGYGLTVTQEVGAENVGKYLYFIKDNNGTKSIIAYGKIESNPVQANFATFCTITPVVTSAPVQASTSPATSQSTLNVTLVCVSALALAAAAFAAKRRSEM